LLLPFSIVTKLCHSQAVVTSAHGCWFLLVWNALSLSLSIFSLSHLTCFDIAVAIYLSSACLQLQLHLLSPSCACSWLSLLYPAFAILWIVGFAPSKPQHDQWQPTDDSQDQYHHQKKKSLTIFHQERGLLQKAMLLV
jgi:hypothetical protein